MSPDDVRKLIKDPAILNLLCGLAALSRVYAFLPDAKVSLTGHFWPILLFTAGFLVGLAPEAAELFEKIPSRIKKWLPWGRPSAYALLAAASGVLLWTLHEDAANTADLLKTCTDVGTGQAL